MRGGFTALIAAMLGLQACGQAETARVTAPPTERLLEFCASDAGDYQDGFCTGYLLGYAYALDRKSGTGVCVPDNIKVPQVREAVVRYLRGNPGAQQQDASVAIPAALRAGFPCNG